MMPFFVLGPEVAGGLGEHTVMDTSQSPPIIARLHYEFEGWLGDELLETYPCFIVTDKLGWKLEQAGLSGFQIREAEISRSPTFEDLYPGTDLPRFLWLDVNGEPGKDDVAQGPQGRLIVSERALDLLRSSQLSYCSVDPLS